MTRPSMRRPAPSLSRMLVATLGAALALPSSALGQEASGQEASGDTAEIRAVVAAFKSALRAGDGEAALAQLHPDVRIFEGGHAETRDEYEGGHLGADMRFLQAVESTTTWDRVHVDSGTAVYLSQYTVKGQYRDREIDSWGTETMVLSRTDAGWKILHIHWSSR